MRGGRPILGWIGGAQLAKKLKHADPSELAILRCGALFIPRIGLCGRRRRRPVGFELEFRCSGEHRPDEPNANLHGHDERRCEFEFEFEQRRDREYGRRFHLHLHNRVLQ